MPQLENRVCPSCKQVCSPLLRACSSCKQPFGTDPPQRVDAPSGGVPTAAAQPRPKVELRNPNAQQQSPAAAPPGPLGGMPATIAAAPIAPVAIGKLNVPVTQPVAAATPSPVRDAWVTAPMDPRHVAQVQSDSNPGARPAGSLPRTMPVHPVATPSPIVVAPPPRAGSRRGAGGVAPLLALIGLLAAGATTIAVWSRSRTDDPEPAQIPLPAPSTTLRPQDSPPPPTAPPIDPSAARPDPSTLPSTAPTPPPPPSAPPRGTRQLGWIPPEATEAIEVTSLNADPVNDPLCHSAQSLVDLGQEIAVSMEKEMREATKISDAEESRIGKRLEIAIARDRSYAGKWDRPDDVRKFGDYVNGIVQHIARGQRRAGITYRIHVAHRPEFNAAALPGGALVVHTGLLEGPDAVHDEAELVAVLGHEIAHVELRHTIAAYQYAKALFGDDADGQIAAKIITMPISSQYENEADERGLELAVTGQYNPQAAVNLWRRRAKIEGDAPGGLLGGILDGLMRSHPRAPIRACRAMKRVLWARDNAPWERVYDGKTNLTTQVIGPKKTY